MNNAEDGEIPEDASSGLPYSQPDSPQASMNDAASALAIATRRFPAKYRARKRSDGVPVVLVDRSALFRTGLRQVLNGSRFQVAVDCGSVQDVPADAFGEGPSVALIGLDRDVAPVLQRIRKLKEEHPSLRVVLLRDRMDVGHLVAAIDSGVDSYLLRDEVKPETILKTLEVVLADGIVVPPGFGKVINVPQRVESAELPASGPELASPPTPPESARPIAVPERVEMPPTATSDLARLSERERLILTRLTLGASNKLIARELDVAEATVKAHVKSLLRKLRVNNRTQAAMWAISRGVSAKHANGLD